METVKEFFSNATFWTSSLCSAFILIFGIVNSIWWLNHRTVRGHHIRSGNGLRTLAMCLFVSSLMLSAGLFVDPGVFSSKLGEQWVRILYAYIALAFVVSIPVWIASRIIYRRWNRSLKSR